MLIIKGEIIMIFNRKKFKASENDFPFLKLHFAKTSKEAWMDIDAETATMRLQVFDSPELCKANDDNKIVTTSDIKQELFFTAHAYTFVNWGTLLRSHEYSSACKYTPGLAKCMFKTDDFTELTGADATKLYKYGRKKWVPNTNTVCCGVLNLYKNVLNIDTAKENKIVIINRLFRAFLTSRINNEIDTFQFLDGSIKAFVRKNGYNLETYAKLTYVWQLMHDEYDKMFRNIFIPAIENYSDKELFEMVKALEISKIVFDVDTQKYKFNYSKEFSDAHVDAISIDECTDDCKERLVNLFGLVRKKVIADGTVFNGFEKNAAGTVEDFERLKSAAAENTFFKNTILKAGFDFAYQNVEKDLFDTWSEKEANRIYKSDDWFWKAH